MPFHTAEPDTPAVLLRDMNGTALTTGSPFAWDATGKSYVEVGSQFVPKQAFWVFGTSAATWTKPIFPAGAVVADDLELVAGWNLVGVTQDLELGTLSEEALGMLVFWVWDGTGQHFAQLKKGDTLRRGQGCWIGLFGADSYVLPLP